MTRRKKFIDPKKDKCVTFKLIHRSQKDPLAADEDAPQRVLQVVKNPNLEKRKEEEHKCGVFFDDEYDYLQHLKKRDNEDKDFTALNAFLSEAKLLPCSKEDEEDVGLLNRAPPIFGPRPDWDPDIVAAMDEDFDYEDPGNQLDDDFMMFANAEEGQSEEDFSHDEERDELFSLENFSDEETRSRFTNYSMSSSVIRRNDGLKLLDDKFENFMAGYDEVNIGGLECDEIEGCKDESSEVMNNIVEEFNRNKEAEKVRDPIFDNKRYHLMEDGEKKIEDLNADFEKVKVDVGDEWDCESVLSTYTNIYNHPKLISERAVDKIKISTKTGMPKDVLGKGLTAAALKRFNLQNEGEELGKKGEADVVTHASKVSVLSFRNKYETIEEKRARKCGMKEYKRERRIERKANRQAFKDEKARQIKVQLNNFKNQQGVKIL